MRVKRIFPSLPLDWVSQVRSYQGNWKPNQDDLQRRNILALRSCEGHRCLSLCLTLFLSQSPSPGNPFYPNHLFVYAETLIAKPGKQLILGCNQQLFLSHYNFHFFRIWLHLAFSIGSFLKKGSAFFTWIKTELAKEAALESLVNTEWGTTVIVCRLMFSKQSDSQKRCQPKFIE